jgi:hypothetical protein
LPVQLIKVEIIVILSASALERGLEWINELELIFANLLTRWIKIFMIEERLKLRDA